MQKSTATNFNGGRAALVIAPQWVGDAIMSLPLIHQLAQEYGAVDVMAVPAVNAVYECCPDIRQIHTVSFVHGQLQWGLRRDIARRFRGQYQTAVVLPNSLKSALVPWLAGIPMRRGMLGESRYWLINDRRTLAPAVDQTGGSRPSMLDQYLALADHAIDRSAIDRFGQHRPVMVMPTAIASFGNHGLGQQAFDAFIQKSIMAICPGAEYGPAKQWPAAYFAQVANDWLAGRDDRAVVVVGGPKDMESATAICAAATPADQILNLTGKTKLLEAFRWISLARVAVSNDSGLMHAAAALGVPVVGIFGSSDPHHTPPHAKTARALSLNLSCSPCFQRVCPLGTTACLRDLAPHQVTDAVNGLIADAPTVHGATSPASL
ncbi:lipopolysaccharide heptosyltransferase II [beta proteobacterium MWH-UniP1]